MTGASQLNRSPDRLRSDGGTSDSGSGRYSFGSLCVDVALISTFLLIVWAAWRSLRSDNKIRTDGGISIEEVQCWNSIDTAINALQEASNDHDTHRARQAIVHIETELDEIDELRVDPELVTDGGTSNSGSEVCSEPGCDEPADAIYSNGVFQEPRCPAHATGDHLTVVKSL